MVGPGQVRKVLRNGGPARRKEKTKYERLLKLMNKLWRRQYPGEVRSWKLSRVARAREILVVVLTLVRQTAFWFRRTGIVVKEKRSCNKQHRPPVTWLQITDWFPLKRPHLLPLIFFESTQTQASLKLPQWREGGMRNWSTLHCPQPWWCLSARFEFNRLQRIMKRMKRREARGEGSKALSLKWKFLVMTTQCWLAQGCRRGMQEGQVESRGKAFRWLFFYLGHIYSLNQSNSLCKKV